MDDSLDRNVHGVRLSSIGKRWKSVTGWSILRMSGNMQCFFSKCVFTVKQNTLEGQNNCELKPIFCRKCLFQQASVFPQHLAVTPFQMRSSQLKTLWMFLSIPNCNKAKTTLVWTSIWTIGRQKRSRWGPLNHIRVRHPIWQILVALGLYSELSSRCLGHSFLRWKTHDKSTEENLQNRCQRNLCRRKNDTARVLNLQLAVHLGEWHLTRGLTSQDAQRNRPVASPGSESTQQGNRDLTSQPFNWKHAMHAFHRHHSVYAQRRAHVSDAELDLHGKHESAVWTRSMESVLKPICPSLLLTQQASWNVTSEWQDQDERQVVRQPWKVSQPFFIKRLFVSQEFVIQGRFSIFLCLGPIYISLLREPLLRLSFWRNVCGYKLHNACRFREMSAK